MRRVVMRVEASALEDVLDRLLPHLPDGVHERCVDGDEVELLAHAISRELPPVVELERLAGHGLVSTSEHDVPADWHERRRRDRNGGTELGGRIWLRSPLDPPPPPRLHDVLIGRSRAFGSGAHPTTRACITVLAELGRPARSSFADLGCGSGALAIAAARLGYAPIHAVDHDPASVAATSDNANRNGVAIVASVIDLTLAPPPATDVVAANVPPAVHLAVAAAMGPEAHVLIASGIRPGEEGAVVEAYGRRGLSLHGTRESDGWLVLSLYREPTALQRAAGPIR